MLETQRSTESKRSRDGGWAPQRISSKEIPYIAPSQVLSASKDGFFKNGKDGKQGVGTCPVDPSDVSTHAPVELAVSKGYCGTVRENFWDVFNLESGARILMAMTVYVMLIFVFELHFFVPYDAGFALLVLWASAVGCGQLMLIVGMPPLLGMLLAGIGLRNLGPDALFSELDLRDSWAAGIRAFGLMNILMRGGLEMDMGAVRRVGMAVVRLTIMPGVSEALCVAGLAMLVFNMPFFLSLAMGFILAAVSPAVVVGGMFDLQSRGYGVRQGIPSLVVAAASFDDVVAISGFSMFIGLASGAGDVLWEAMHGPINIIGGILFGLLGAWILCLTRIWDQQWKRSFMMIVLGTAFTFAAKKAHFDGAGALACLVMAAAANQFWSRGTGGRFSLGPDHHAAHLVERDLCKVWQIVAEPLLFSVIGSALDFTKIEPGTIPKAIGLIFGAVTVRCVVAYFSTCGAGLTTKERVFIALAWMPKATVQAALGPVPLDMMRKAMKTTDEGYETSKQHGVDILTTAVFSILLTAPAGLLVIQYLGPAWLEREAPTPTVDRVEEVAPEDCGFDDKVRVYDEVLPTLPPKKEDSEATALGGVVDAEAKTLSPHKNHGWVSPSNCVNRKLPLTSAEAKLKIAQAAAQMTPRSGDKLSEQSVE